MDFWPWMARSVSIGEIPTAASRRVGPTNTIPSMDFWLFLHLVAMAFFLGGQLMLAAVVVPVVRGDGDPAAMKAVARRYGIGSAVAILVLIISGVVMAAHYNLWSTPEFHLKMGLFIAVLVALGLHIKFSESNFLRAAILLLTLGIVWAGIALPV